MELSDYRQKLDGIDSRLLALFIERMEIVAEIAAWKRKNKLPVLDERREREKREAIAAQSPEELQEYTAAFFAKIMELSREHQKRLLRPDEKDEHPKSDSEVI